MYFLNEFMKNITARRYIDFQHNLSKILIIRPNLIIYTLKPIELIAKNIISSKSRTL